MASDLSARSEKSLRASAANLSNWVKEHAETNGSSPVLPDLPTPSEPGGTIILIV